MSVQIYELNIDESLEGAYLATLREIGTENKAKFSKKYRGGQT